ncbi:fatty acid synthase-like protein, partial [Dinothrombium tinctorium]
GKQLFPATGYLQLAWMALTTHSQPLGFSVEFSNVKFERTTLVQNVGSFIFKVNLNRETGRFQIIESGSVCASGTIRTKEELSKAKKDILDTSFEENLDKAEANGSNLIEIKNVNRNIVVGNNSLIIKNILGAAISRKTMEKLVDIREESFIPYQRFFSSFQTKRKFEEYKLECLKIVERIMSENFEIDLNVLKEKFDLESEENVLLRLLIEIVEEKNVDSIKDKIEKHRTNMTSDLLVRPFNDKLLLNQSDVFFENINSRDIQIIEINSTEKLLLDSINEQLLISRVSLSVTLVHPSKNKTSSQIQKVLHWENDKIPFPSSVNDVDLILFNDFSTSLVLIEELIKFRVNLSELLTSAYDSLKTNGFVLCHFRTNITSVEEKLLKLQNIEIPKFYSLNEIRDAIEKTKFAIISENSDEVSN